MSIDARGLKNAAGCHRDIVKHFPKVGAVCPINLTVIPGGGLRTPAQVADNVKRDTGVLDSMHLPQADGTAWAIDILPVDAGGNPYWDELAARVITPCVFQVFDEVGMAIQNGGDWDQDGIYCESGKAAESGREDDLHHYQLLRANKMARGIAAMQRRNEQRATVHLQPELTEGSRDIDAVKRLQLKLGALKIDGQFGPGTRRRLVAFQTLARVGEPGVVCVDTWRALIA